MGYVVDTDSFSSLLKDLRNSYKIYAPRVYKNKGRTSDTDLVSYGEIETTGDIAFDRKTIFSPKEIVFPINQTMFCFAGEESKENISEEKLIIFLRACDINGVDRLDTIFLRNGPYSDIYYEKIRNNVKFFLMDCSQSWNNCFCVSMNSNKASHYSVYVKKENGRILCQVRDDEFQEIFRKYGGEAEVEPQFIEENKVKIEIPAEIDPGVFEHRVWEDYTIRCSACGRCTVSCPTCTCFTIQDLSYRDNYKYGERRRTWASCMIDGFTDMAGGTSFRTRSGDRLRYRVLHKVLDFKKKFGFHMCVGCGRCDDVCPEYISFSKCINKLGEITQR